jgi:hypothetical protein
MRKAFCQMIPSKRPGIARAFIQPVKLKDQVEVGAPTTPLKFKKVGKTLVGTTQWAFRIPRPGLAKALIVPKKEMQAMKQLQKGLEMEKAVKEKIKAEAAGTPTPIAKVVAPPAAAGMSGWYRYY